MQPFLKNILSFLGFITLMCKDTVERGLYKNGHTIGPKSLESQYDSFVLLKGEDYR